MDSGQYLELIRKNPNLIKPPAHAFWILDVNYLLLTERKGRTGKLLPDVFPVRKTEEIQERHIW